MYELLNKPAAIKEVQKFLYVISDRVNNEVPRVAIDGIYGDETRNAVLIFQQLYDLDGDGTVDRITFDKMYVLYKEAVNDDLSSDYIITENGFPVKVGDQNNDVVYIHLLINELRKTYQDIQGVDTKSNYFSDVTKKAVEDLEQIFSIDGNGEVDVDFLSRMEMELEALKRIRETYI